MGIADNIVNLLKNNKETWRTELKACNESLGKLILAEGFFSGIIFHLWFLSLLLYLY